jgi:hypothetical protein
MPQLTIQTRFSRAYETGKMQYKGWKIRRWADGEWHVYAPKSLSCEYETLSLISAIKFIDTKLAPAPAAAA